VREKRRRRTALFQILLLSVTFVVALLFPRAAGTSALSRARVEGPPPQTYLGFDANDYPGDDALPQLRRTFTFSGYWLNAPPGTKTNSWTGHRAALLKNGFGFLVLFNGRLSKELKSPVNPNDLGVKDGELAVAAAQREGFLPASIGTVIFLDIEEGGRMLPSQLDYLEGWKGRVTASGFVAGVYCSGMKVRERDGQTITTADDIHDHLPMMAYFIYNDACPPSPGCAYLKNPPSPSRSGFSQARVWQFAQSPRRRNFTARCSATYSSDGNCYPPVSSAAGPILIDLDSSVSPDPSVLGLRVIY
jgi:Domain of unknown function (DUF1906)